MKTERLKERARGSGETDKNMEHGEKVKAKNERRKMEKHGWKLKAKKERGKVEDTRRHPPSFAWGEICFSKMNTNYPT